MQRRRTPWLTARRTRRSIRYVHCQMEGPHGARRVRELLAPGRRLDPRYPSEAGLAACRFQLCNAVIVIEGERIIAVGAGIAVAAKARVLDLSDSAVLPGFIDAHTHIGAPLVSTPGWEEAHARETAVDTVLRGAFHARQTLEAGYTTIREVGARASSVTSPVSRKELQTVPTRFGAPSATRSSTAPISSRSARPVASSPWVTRPAPSSTAPRN